MYTVRFAGRFSAAPRTKPETCTLGCEARSIRLLLLADHTCGHTAAAAAAAALAAAAAAAAAAVGGTLMR